MNSRCGDFFAYAVIGALVLLFWVVVLALCWWLVGLVA